MNVHGVDAAIASSLGGGGVSMRRLLSDPQVLGATAKLYHDFGEKPMWQEWARDLGDIESYRGALGSCGQCCPV